jgi:23S rRNA (uridine2552-2'-O)-methyltransferase
MKKVQDHYFHQAKKEGFVARSAFKLQEIDRKYRLFKAGQRVLDLGCCPGSWMQYISGKIGQKGRVLGIDIKTLELPLKPNMGFIRADIFDCEVHLAAQTDPLYDLICSDMAPNTTGIRDVDAERSVQLCEAALDIADRRLRVGGAVLVKVFQGGSQERLIIRLKSGFRTVNIIKPKSSRDESREVFVLGADRKS